MSGAVKENSDFSCEVVKVLRSERVDDKNRLDLRIVKWRRASRPVFEKRRIWERKDGDRPTKMVGLDAEDLKFVRDNYAEIANLL